MRNYLIKVFLCICMLTAIQGCNKSKTASTDETVNINFDTLEKCDSAFSLFQGLKTKIIPLETRQDCLIDMVRKLVVDDNEYYIMTQGNLYKFSDSGRFICGFGSRGNGPGEYNTVSGFCILSDSVYLYDSNTEKILVFDKKGHFEKEIAGVRSLKFAIDITSLDATTALVANGVNFDGQDILYGTWNPNAPGELNPVERTTLTSAGNFSFSNHPIAVSGKEALFFVPFGNVVYGYDTEAGKASPRYAIAGVGYEEAGTNDYSELLGHALTQGAGVILNLFDTDRYLIVNLMKGSIIWDKEQKTGCNVAPGFSWVDEYNIPFYTLMINYASGNEIISVRQAQEIIGHVGDSGNIPGGSDLTEESNPVIVKYEIANGHS